MRIQARMHRCTAIMAACFTSAGPLRHERFVDWFVFLLVSRALLPACVVPLLPCCSLLLRWAARTVAHIGLDATESGARAVLATGDRRWAVRRHPLLVGSCVSRFTRLVPPVPHRDEPTDCDERASDSSRHAHSDQRQTAMLSNQAHTAMAHTLSQPSAVLQPVPPPKLLPLMLTAVSPARATAAIAAAAAADSTVIPQPLPSTAFPTSTWHSSLPATGMPDLAPWFAQGLGSSQADRLGRLVRVYSLGFHQLIRAVRAGMTDPSGTVANLWKMFVFLLHDCMPDGSINTMRIAQMEREQNARARELLTAREAELAKLLKLETELQIRVQALDLALRRVQSHRQNAEDARLEALDSITAQQALEAASLEEITELKLQSAAWLRRFHLAQNRHRMLAEDIRQNQRQQCRLQQQQRTLIDEVRSKHQKQSTDRARSFVGTSRDSISLSFRLRVSLPLACSVYLPSVTKPI